MYARVFGEVDVPRPAETVDENAARDAGLVHQVKQLRRDAAVEYRGFDDDDIDVLPAHVGNEAVTIAVRYTHVHRREIPFVHRKVIRQEIPEHGDTYALRQRCVGELAKVLSTFAQLVDAIARDLTDRQSFVGQSFQQAQFLNVDRAVHATPVRCSLGNDGAIASFPDTNRVVGQSCQFCNGTDAVLAFAGGM